MVQHIECLRTEFHFHPLRDPDVLEQRRFPGYIAGANEAVSCHVSVATQARYAEETICTAQAGGVVRVRVQSKARTPAVCPLIVARSEVAGGGVWPVVANAVEIEVAAGVNADLAVDLGLAAARHESIRAGEHPDAAYWISTVCTGPGLPVRARLPGNNPVVLPAAKNVPQDAFL